MWAVSASDFALNMAAASTTSTTSSHHQAHGNLREEERSLVNVRFFSYICEER